MPLAVMVFLYIYRNLHICITMQQKKPIMGPFHYYYNTNIEFLVSEKSSLYLHSFLPYQFSFKTFNIQISAAKLLALFTLSLQREIFFCSF